MALFCNSENRDLFYQQYLPEIQLSGLRYSMMSNTKDRGTENDKMA